MSYGLAWVACSASATRGTNADGGASVDALSGDARTALRAARAAVRAANRARKAALHAGAALKPDATRVSAADYAAQAAALAVLSSPDSLKAQARVYAEEPVRDFSSAPRAIRQAAADALGWSEEQLILAMNTPNTGKNAEAEPTWWIDPVDGSEGYLRDMGWAVGVARMYGAAALALPQKHIILVADESLWVAGEDGNDNEEGNDIVRHHAPPPPRRWHFSPAGLEHLVTGLLQPERLCCGSLVKYGEVALGLSQALVQQVPKRVAYAWDHAAGVACVRAAGGVVTDIEGEQIVFEDSALLRVATGAFVASAPGAKHEEWLHLARKACGKK